MVLNDRNYSYSSYHTLNDKAHEIFAKKKKSPNMNLKNFYEFKTFLGYEVGRPLIFETWDIDPSFLS